MKSTKLITSIAAFTLGMTLVVPTVVSADADTLKGNGSITYEEDNTPNPPTDPEIPTDPVDPPGPINPDGGTLSVDMVGDLTFKNGKINSNEGKYFAKEATTQNGKGETIKRGNWVQVTDKRDVKNNKPSGWELSAQLTKQFTNADGGVLTGATLNYINPVVTSKADQSGTITGLTPSANVVLAYDAAGSSTPMLKAEDGNGFGTYYIQYGREEGFGGLTAADKTSDKSIELTVPANTPLAAQEYKAEITWTIKEL